MDAIGRFISDENIARFVDQLRIEANPNREEMLKRLLVEEENRFGATEERLGMVERQLSDGAAHIIRQTCIVAKLKCNGGDSAIAERALRASEMIQALFENFRAVICESRELHRL